MSSKKKYKIPDDYFFRLHHVRPRFKNDVEEVLLYVATSISESCFQKLSANHSCISFNGTFKIIPHSWFADSFKVLKKPCSVKFAEPIKTISLFEYSIEISLAWNPFRVLLGFGWNNYSQLSTGKEIDKPQILDINIKDDIKSISCGSHHNLILTRN